MTNAIKILLVCSMFASIPLLVGCGDDDDGGGGSDPCAEADAVVTAAISAYCADKLDYCCYCQCWESSFGLYDQPAYMDDQTCDCLDPEQTEAAECDGYNLDYANTCLEDEIACGEGAVVTAEGVCQASPL